MSADPGVPRIDVTRHYSNGEVTIVWRSALCRHTGICFRGLPQVFDPRRRPWIIPTAASTDEIITQVRRCPSGALSLEEPAEPVVAEPAAAEARGGDPDGEPSDGDREHDGDGDGDDP